MIQSTRQDPATVRCAIYTRKSSEEGLEQEFNSLHAQREACEAYIASHSEADFTHGICPECAHRLYPELNLNKG